MAAPICCTMTGARPSVVEVKTLTITDIDVVKFNEEKKRWVKCPYSEGQVTIGQRVAFADSARTGRLVADLDANSPAAREIAALAAEIARIGR